MAGRLDGKVALISGAARGMGECEARLFAREGAKVVLGDMLEEQGRRVATEITQQGGAATFLHLDVTVESDWQRAVETAERTYGKLNVLVNNAGIVRMAPLDETSLEAWNEVINVNQTGVFLGMKHAVPAMRRAGGGSIINISSVAGLIGLPGIPAYQASKGAGRVLVRHRVRVGHRRWVHRPVELQRGTESDTKSVLSSWLKLLRQNERVAFVVGSRFRGRECSRKSRCPGGIEASRSAAGSRRSAGRAHCPRLEPARLRRTRGSPLHGSTAALAD